MAKNYERLSDMERALIQAKLETGLQRSASTTSRELKRCSWQGQSTAAPRLRARGINGYWCESAHRRACLLAAKARTAPKLVVGMHRGNSSTRARSKACRAREGRFRKMSHSARIRPSFRALRLAGAAQTHDGDAALHFEVDDWNLCRLSLINVYPDTT